MTTRFDGEDDLGGPDDPLTVLLGPPAGHLAPPPGHFEKVRRSASRRRLLRTSAGAALTCAALALGALPLYFTGSDAPARPAPPLAPPPATGSPTPSDRSAPPVTGRPSPAPSVPPSEQPGPGSGSGMVSPTPTAMAPMPTPTPTSVPR
ncbi:hypothetical protein [Streptomyces sp. NPDC058739]|uniref:hypothetical protein n=1 Tax=Streptomyces sp. NPDC058739 TaxID=3346618 RepID=UPI003675C751